MWLWTVDLFRKCAPVERPPRKFPESEHVGRNIWVFVEPGPRSQLCRCRHTHGRNWLRPYGNPYPFVVEGNTLGCRVALLLIIAAWRGVVFFSEQPDGTALPDLPRMQYLWSLVQAGPSYKRNYNAPACRRVVFPPKKTFLIQLRFCSRSTPASSTWGSLAGLLPRSTSSGPI